MRVLLATGGTGGHIIPAIKTGLEFKKRGAEVLLVGSFKLDRAHFNQYGIEIREHGACEFKLSRFWKTITSNIEAMQKAGKILREFQPDLVIGFGSYSSFAIVLRARFSGITTMIHEQNVIPGKANKLLAPFARKIVTSFKGSQKYFPKKKVVLTGLPCHDSVSGKSRQELCEIFGLQENRKTILVIGGSQGSQPVNTVFLKYLEDSLILQDIQVIHCVGKANLADVRKKYQKLDLPGAVYDFFEDIHFAYELADVIISRAGAGSVMEIAGYGKPAILIPYPYAGSHQMENALTLQGSNFIRILNQDQLTEETLQEALIQLLKIGSVEEKNSVYTDVFIPEAEKKIVDVAEGEVGEV